MPAFHGFLRGSRINGHAGVRWGWNCGRCHRENRCWQRRRGREEKAEGVAAGFGGGSVFGIATRWRATIPRQADTAGPVEWAAAGLLDAGLCTRPAEDGADASGCGADLRRQRWSAWRGGELCWWKSRWRWRAVDCTRARMAVWRRRSRRQRRWVSLNVSTLQVKQGEFVLAPGAGT